MLVDVYRNLNESRRTGRVSYSVRAHGGRVLLRTEALAVRDCAMHVGQAARLRVAAGGPRNVHAWVEGTLTIKAPPACGRWVALRYDPRLFATFVERDTLAPVHVADWVRFDASGAWAINPRRTTDDRR